MSQNPVPPRIPPKSPVPAKAVPPRAMTADASAKSPAPAKPAVPASVASSPLASAKPAVKAPAPARPPVAVKAPVTATPATPKVTGTPEDLIIAGPASYYRMTRYIMVTLLLGMGLWFGYDGFKGWPNENTQITELAKKLDQLKKADEGKPSPSEEYTKLSADPLARKPIHTDFDIMLQKGLAFGLPVAALLMFLWARHNSRGEYRIAGQLLSVPGHPNVPFAAILEIDKALWDRKGIAYVTYRSGAGKAKLRLDDFIYERDPTDEIYKRLEAYMGGGDSVPPPIAPA